MLNNEALDNVANICDGMESSAPRIDDGIENSVPRIDPRSSSINIHAFSLLSDSLAICHQTLVKGK